MVILILDFSPGTAATGALIAAPDWNRLPMLAAWWLSTAYVCGLCAWRSLRPLAD